MSRAKQDGIAKVAAPSTIAVEYRRLGARLLKRLAEDNVHAERRGEQIVIVRAGSKISVASGMPTGVLSELLHSGAVRCVAKGGETRFVITPEGRARHRRESMESEDFAIQHRVLERRIIGTESVQVNLREDPLNLLRSGRTGLGLVGSAEFDAAQRFRRDLAMAQTLPQITANWSRLVVDGAGHRGGVTPSEAMMEARRRVDAAMHAIDPDFRGILIDVCGFSKGIEILERENGFPARSGKLVLAFALRQLARHYGYSNATSNLKQVEIRQWGADDYRPALRTG